MQTFNVLPKLLAAAVVTLAAGHCAAAVITTAQGDGADTYIRLGQGSTNFGTAGDVVIKDSGGTSTTRKGYLRFDLSAETGAFLDAELLLDVILNNSAGGDPPPNEYTVRVYGLNDDHAGNSWGESTITWNNAPANVTSNNLVGKGATFLGRFTVPALEPTYPVSFDNPVLRNFLNQDTDGLATFILTRQGGGGSNNLAFASKEHGSAAEPALSGITVPAYVRSISTNDGDGADSYVQLGNATGNFGNSGGVTIKNSGGGGTTRKGYLRFDLAGTPPDLLDAALTLQVATNNQGGGGTTPQNFSVDVFGLVDGHAGELWDEMGINWNNAPANSGGNSLTSEAIPLGSFEVLNDPEGSRVMFTSPELIDFLSADTNGLASLILTRETGGSSNLVFGSGEHGSFLAPTLTITGVPEPSTGLLLAFALLGLAVGRHGRRSRRTIAGA